MSPGFRISDFEFRIYLREGRLPEVKALPTLGGLKLKTQHSKLKIPNWVSDGLF